MKKVVLYFAGPLFSEGERRFNASLMEKIRALGIEVLAAQERCADLDSDTEMDVEEKNKAIFKRCLDDDLVSDIFLYILDGRVPDEGAAFELGVAYAQKMFGIKPNRVLIGLKTDWRVCFKISDVNQMLEESMSKIFNDEDSLLKFLTTCRAE